jgi:hypothetical protein
MIAVDAKSGYPEITPMKKTDAKHTIQSLRRMISRFGMPRIIHSDNGPPFTSAEFREWLKDNNIQSSLSAPYNPESNGIAERMVQSFKSGMKKIMVKEKSIMESLETFLFNYRTTPKASGKSPGEIFLGRQINTKMSLLKPRKIKREENSTGKIAKEFQIGQPVYARAYNTSSRRYSYKWMKGIIIDILGTVTYLIKVGEDFWKRNVNQIRERKIPVVIQKDFDIDLKPEIPTENNNPPENIPEHVDPPENIIPRNPSPEKAKSPVKESERKMSLRKTEPVNYKLLHTVGRKN